MGTFHCPPVFAILASPAIFNLLQVEWSSLGVPASMLPVAEAWTKTLSLHIIWQTEQINSRRARRTRGEGIR